MSGPDGEPAAPAEWVPGDPVHPAPPTAHGSCGVCLERWTAEVDVCPSCGALSTEALRARLDAVEQVCAAAEYQATRWADPLPVPEWVGRVRAAAQDGVVSP